MDPKYPVSDEVKARLLDAFTYHQPKADQPERYEALRNNFLVLALMLAEQCPPSRELSLAFTKLEEASMHANSAIARHE